MLEPHLLGRYNKENWFLGFWMMEIQEGGKNILYFCYTNGSLRQESTWGKLRLEIRRNLG